MGNVLEQICHSAALEVDYKEGDVVGAVINRERKHKGLDEFTFARARCTRDESVRAVVLLVNIEIDVRVARLFAY